jgi:hypothetical protein
MKDVFMAQLSLKLYKDYAPTTAYDEVLNIPMVMLVMWL